MFFFISSPSTTPVINKRTTAIAIASNIVNQPIETMIMSVSNSRIENNPFPRSEEHTSELQSRFDLVCRLLLEKKKKDKTKKRATPHSYYSHAALPISHSFFSLRMR